MNNKNSDNELEVKKEGGLFVLRAMKDGEWLERVLAMNAQMIIDYVKATWPVGTIIQWKILPRRLQLQET